MSVTEQEVRDKAKELGMELSDDEIKAHVVLKTLPSKEGDPPPPKKKDEELDELDEKDLTEGMRKRINRMKEKHSEEMDALKDTMTETQKKLKDFETKEAEAQKAKDEQKGNYEKLSKEAEEAKTKADAAIQATRERFKETMISQKVEESLLRAGVPQDRLTKAIKLFDESKVTFKWLNEETMEYEVKDLSSEVEAFKKDNSFLFGDSDSSSDWSGKKKQGGHTKKDEEKVKEMKKKFPVFRNF